MGAVLIALTVGVLVLDSRFAPWYPFLFLLLLTLALLGCHEFLALLGPARRPWPGLCYASVTVLVVVNWSAHLDGPWARDLSLHALSWILGTYAAVVLATLVAGLATYQPPDESASGPPPDTVVCVALAAFIASYLGVLPSFLVQLRWPEPASLRADDARAVLAMALAIFIPKCCDTGAYTIGRLIGRHKMSPAISPGKTWEGLAGGLATAVLAAILLNRLGPVLPGEGVLSDVAAAGFGLTVGGAGVLGDLAESLIKRQYRQKDASQAMPGFGGVLDVIDSIVFAAPIAYCWLG
jgi:phosphatidate cytidylyltransferase